VTPREVKEYRQLNSDDRNTFRLWLIANTVAGALAFFALIAAASIYSGDVSNVATAQKESRVAP
jgi:hypothetical protein